MPRFFLADPSLTSYSGHCWSYLNSLIAPVKASRFEPLLIGNLRIEDGLHELADIVPVFQHWCDARYGTHDETLQVHESGIRSDLNRATKAFRFTSNDVMLINTLRHWSLAGVVDWLESLPEDRRPFVVLVLHFTAFPDPESASDTLIYYQRAFDRIQRSPASRRILLMADSQELIDEYRDINSRLQYVLAPIPHAPVHASAAKTRGRDSCTHVGYIGEARENKGFHLLPYLIRRIQRSPLCERVRFHLHAFAHDQYSRFYRQIVSRLDAPCVTLYRNRLDDEEYQRFLDCLDVVVLPYTRMNYHAQTSGVLAEAIAAGKTVVCPRGTWMARQTVEYSAGVTFNPNDQEDLAHQTMYAIETNLQFREGADRRAESWMSFHNAERLVGQILEARAAATSAAPRRQWQHVQPCEALS